MNRIEAYGEYHRCLTELDALYHDVTVEQWDKCQRPSWLQPLVRIIWNRELRDMQETLRFAS